MELEIQPLSKVNASVQVPGSKSYTNRALIIASLADGISYLGNCLLADDTQLMIKALQELGIPIAIETNNLTVMGRSGRMGLIRKPLFAGNAGTTLRFLASLVALGHGRYTLDGDERMRERPVADLLDGLKQLGTKAYGEKKEGYPPIIVEANGLKGGKVSLRADRSSQYLSSILMAAPYAQKPVQISIEGKLVSKPYVDMTLALMKIFGVEVTEEKGKIFKISAPQKYKPQAYQIEADASNASYFFAAAAVTEGRICVTNMNPHTLQGDIKILDLMSQMGCKVQKNSDSIIVEGGPLRGIQADLQDIPDMVPTLAIMALFAQGETFIKNIAHLKIKETDRIEALANELRKIGAQVEAGNDYLKIIPQPLHSASIKTYNDHRMAMSFAIAGLKIPGLIIQDPECVKKSYPGFWNDLNKLYGQS